MLASPPPGYGDYCVAVLVNCVAGMHRSGAMAERLAWDVEGWGLDEVFVSDVQHLDTDVVRGMRRVQRARVRTHGRERERGDHDGYPRGKYRSY